MGGEWTGKLGLEIRQKYINNPEIKVFYDHLNPADDHTCAPSPHWGEIRNENKLSEVDIAILQNGQVKILCEVEEKGTIKDTGISPKKFLGDVFNLFLATHLSIKCPAFKGDPELNNYNFVLAVEVSDKGASEAKYDQLSTRMRGIPRAKYLEQIKLECIITPNKEQLRENLLRKINKILET